MLGDILKNPGIPNLNFSPDAKLGDLLSSGFQIVVLLAGFLAFIWFIWGAFEYIFAGGDKQKLEHARSHITWAIVGLIVILLSFLIAQFIQQVLLPGKTGVTPLL